MDYWLLFNNFLAFLCAIFKHYTSTVGTDLFLGPLSPSYLDDKLTTLSFKLFKITSTPRLFGKSKSVYPFKRVKGKT